MGILFLILCVVFLGSTYLYKPGSNYMDYVSSLPMLQNEESASKVTALQHEAHEKQIKTLEKAIDSFNQGHTKLEAAVDALKNIGDKERAIEWLVKEAASKVSKGADGDKTKSTAAEDSSNNHMKEALDKLEDITKTLDDIASKKLPAAINNNNNNVNAANAKKEAERSVAEQQALIKEIKKLLATKDTISVDPEDPSSCSMLDKGIHPIYSLQSIPLYFFYFFLLKISIPLSSSLHLFISSSLHLFISSSSSSSLHLHLHLHLFIFISSSSSLHLHQSNDLIFGLNNLLG